MKFNLILADPPWQNSKSGPKMQGGHSGDLYSDLSVPELMKLPVRELADDDAYLFLWVDAQHPHIAPAVANSWGFPHFATKLTWLKTSPKSGKDVFGIGRYTMVWAEDCWIFKRGKPAFVSTKVSNPFYAEPEGNAFYADRTNHSRKPDWLYEFIEGTHTKYGKQTRWPDNRLELFARTHFKDEKLWEPRQGWAQVGNEFEDTLGEGIEISIQNLIGKD